MLDPDRNLGTLGLLVIRDGKLVFETYLQDPADRDHVQHLQSATKSVSSIAVGIGRDEGWMPELSTPICDVFGPKCDGLDPAPGAEYRYRDADPQLVSFLVQELTGDTEEALIADRLFELLIVQIGMPDAELHGSSIADVMDLTRRLWR